jgi:hypothetical protein
MKFSKTGQEKGDLLIQMTACYYKRSLACRGCGTFQIRYPLWFTFRLSVL